MDKILEVTLLYDFYGMLLTQKQRRYFEMYYQMDFSLSEIGEEENISPQAVRDLLQRVIKKINDYEEKLSLVKKHLETEDNIKKILFDIEIVSGEIKEIDLKNKILDIKDRLNKLDY